MRPDARKFRYGSTGTPVVLADGQTWLLAEPRYRPTALSLTSPPVDDAIEMVFESFVLGEPLTLITIWTLARKALLENYDLSEEEVAALLTVSPGPEADQFAARVFRAIFPSDGDDVVKTYIDWVRASLIANGLGVAEIAARDLGHVLAILVATNRTVPLSGFADACRESESNARLETLL